MRSAFAALVLLGAAALIHGQPPKEAPKEPPKEAPKEPPKDEEFAPRPREAVPRYGVNPRVKAYPQTTPREALKSAVAAIEKGEFAYLAAHLLDPKFIDDLVAERAKPLEAGVAAEFVRLRDFQRANPSRVADEDRVPQDGPAFTALVTARARERTFRQVARELEQKLSDDPQPLKEMRRVLRAPSPFAEADPVATATLPEIKGRTLYFKRVGDRWFLENRSADEPKKEP